MKLEVAIRLIEKGIHHTTGPQHWADFGAGNGLFTRALATRLPSGSSLHAIDKDATALKAIDLGSAPVTLNKLRTDFINEEPDPGPLDGILIANALHYVPHTLAFLTYLKKILKPSGRIILIEYDRDTGNQWVPFPVSYAALQLLAPQAGFKAVTKMGEEPSVYSQVNIYSALLLQEMGN
ncbi:methyltransferase [Fulvivirgaceae bacterium PWU4]|uniref:Methyltransferase n=1 Tax=Chryseosolibacter histidini TaxID=2782349 RepID=A0AAP2GNS4_9BACT|nr:class I SAM-dependent methyltransferase [Chryseosolibacter histidini]MBT1697180.1 methyltransferase [Chryseosolibacter histidini]